MDSTTGEICCRLCFCPNGNFLNIFNDAPSVFDIAELLKKYFQDEVKLSDPLPNIICSDCWRKTESFHEFHEKVLNEREKYLNSHFDHMGIKTEPETILVTDISDGQFDEFDVNMCVDPITVKPNHIDNQNNVLNDHEPFSNISSECGNEILLPENVESNCVEFSVIKEQSVCEHESFSYIGENHKEKEADLYSRYFDMTCDKCENVFESLEEALIHYNQTHMDQNGYIKCCNLQFNEISLARDHLKWHLNPDIFKCDQCDDNFQTRKDLQSHIRAFHLSRSFICDYCGKSCKAKQKLEIHMLGVHIHVRMKHRCGLCERKFKTFKQLHTHLESIHPDDMNNILIDTKNIPLLSLNDDRMKAANKKFVDQTCDICHLKLDTLAIAKSHYLTEHKIPKGYVKCCRVKLLGEKALINHLNWHINPNIFRCRLCCKAFIARRSIKDHMKKHETLQSKRFTCDTCSDIFPTIEDYRSHMETTHSVTIPKRMYPDNEFTSMQSVWHKDPERFKCDQCERKFKVKRSLLIHQAEAHMNKLIKCRICYKRFDTNATLADHMLFHQEKLKFSCPDPDCKKSFFKESSLRAHINRGHQVIDQRQICEFCAKVFKTKAQLKLHCRNVHKQGPQKPKQKFKCDICLNFYSTKGILRTHLLNHSSGPFKCTIEHCNKIAPTASALDLHMKAVHVEAKFKCHLCDRSFKLAPALKDHIATHLNKKQYKCSYCDMEFIWRTNMYKHRKLVHRTEWEADKAKKDAEKKMP